MKAVRFSEFGDVGVLRHEEIDRPKAGPGQVLVQVAATTFNPLDAAIRLGVMAEIFPVELPYTPGLELSGTVAEVGAGVTNLQVGDAVIGSLPITAGGAAAEYAVAPAEVLVAAPVRVPLADAAALPVAGLTAAQGLFEHGGMKPGQRVLINGAGGGVGALAVQLAKRAGATVLATAGPRSAGAVKAHGADEIIDYTVTPVAEAVTEPVDVVLNLVAGPPEAINALTGLIVDGGVGVSAPHLPLTDDSARGVRWIQFDSRTDTARLAELVSLVDSGELTLDVSARYPLADLATVHAAGQAGELRGKALVVVRN